jgi:hypothetical protein
VVELFLDLSWNDPRLALRDQGTSPRVFQGEEAEEMPRAIGSPDVELQSFSWDHVVLTRSAFWGPAEERFQVEFIALLTVVAFHMVIAKSLARLDYPTIAAAVLIVCYLVAWIRIGGAWHTDPEAGGAELELATAGEAEQRTVSRVVASETAHRCGQGCRAVSGQAS